MGARGDTLPTTPLAWLSWVHRCIKLALVHDVAEAIVGDITPHCGVSDADKYSMEADAVQRIKQMLGGGTLAGGANSASGAQVVWARVHPRLQCVAMGLQRCAQCPARGCCSRGD